MNTRLKRLGIVVLACFTLMSFRLEPEATNADRLLYDVRGAFVAARPDVAPALMQSIHAQLQNAIKTTARGEIRPRVVLTIRLASVTRGPFLFGERASARVIVRAAAVATGEVIAEAKFTATVVSFDNQSIDQDLAYGVAERVIREFRLSRTGPTTLATALFP
ncbi:hypothetical protein G6L16_005420 [Agrobacterium tumefaciens]|uniref:hypothetical protein n=1 Tax=Agrobacterium tumefaciens TaxID=358 RepID=UPI0015716CA0|nr:hypothetical protein [Agrobacterium tumefaciens]NSZ62778.1 hypothetical protein [Agrobacterium tumefaciens]NTA69148.1 hypothetical protein [Agrobacterium tumefaciens]WIE38950.1 hypothetical protein G6L16_005420 [Agrobacterium tumefaciens]